MERRSSRLISHSLALVFLVYFVAYAFSTSKWAVEDGLPWVPVIRILVVVTWLGAIYFMSFRSGRPVSITILLTATILPLLAILVSRIDLNPPFVLSYVFIAAFAAASRGDGKWWQGVMVWLLVIIAQLIVDILIAMTGLYGTFQIM